MAVEPKLSDQEIASLMEIPHPSKGLGESIYGATKVFPDYQAEPGETYLGMVHGIAHESSVTMYPSSSIAQPSCRAMSLRGDTGARTKAAMTGMRVPSRSSMVCRLVPGPLSSAMSVASTTMTSGVHERSMVVHRLQ